MGKHWPSLTAIALAAALLCAACAGCNEQVEITPKRDTVAVVDNGGDVAEQGLFISPSAAEALRSGGAIVLDARAEDDFLDGHIAGAAHAPWQDFVDGELSGLLASDLGRVEAALRRVGVRQDKPVVVYGGWRDAWGEEGRLMWMLEYLGHDDVRIMQGGFERWERAGFPVSEDPATPTPGDFAAKPVEDRRATVDEVLQASDSGGVVIIDTRDPSEYEGATPYGSDRGGHIPNAQPFWWKDVFDASGQLRAKDELRAIFDAMGIQDDTVVIAYCTGGVRSGFFYAVMRWLGYSNTQNYDGSWWEWASRADLPVSDANDPTSQPGE